MADTTLVGEGLPTGWTIGTQIYESDATGSRGNTWNGTGYVPLDEDAWADYATATPETSPGTYTCQFPLSSPPGWYAWIAYKQSGDAPSPSDSATIAFQSAKAYWWNGVTFSEAPATPPSPTTGIAPPLNGLTNVYCTDENIALRAWGDFMAICPPGQKVAEGKDGGFGTVDRWTLISATVDFLAAGVGPGCVVWLKQGNTYGSNGEIFAVASVASGQVTLRRMGQNAGVGQPPGPGAGLTGVTFSVLTFAPQIDVASYDANHFFGIDPISMTKSPARLYDQRELQSYVVLMVLKRAYAISLKQKAEDYALKLEQVSDEFNDLTSRLVIRWGTDGKSEPPTTAFSARARR